MNIFFLDKSPTKAARMLIWKRHIIKMPLETAQIMSDAAHELGLSFDRMYKRPGGNPYPRKWVLLSRNNLDWLYEYSQELLGIYTDLYNRQHKCKQIIDDAFATLSTSIPSGEFVSPYIVVPSGWESSDPFSAFRSYYLAEKVSSITGPWLYKDAIKHWSDAHQNRIRRTLNL